ncbi:NGG1p interacting factor 3 protein, NIF3 [Thiomicrorhabdus sp. Milos-T2]|uniref:NGG1p interacting factor 3 protein, NIF3 n=1 Tax=Thiomicrorhabdus sp. Milos-T2 TaxID=90814 RepID=UPI000493DD73|nr:NGG1p interacting factor 3 protein, NIF3 [Thiomicrorhabdus sp. Milos-T2]
MFKIIFFVPEEYVEVVKQAMFQAGAGHIGDYDCCAWQIKGEGQFRPLKGSCAYIGNQNELSKVEEYRVELVCKKECIKAAMVALKSVHPYETPAYEVLQMIDVLGEYC